jgi:hypothetical protein
MNMIRTVMICLAASLLWIPLAHAQDLSKYRQFSLGTSLAEISKQTDLHASDVTTSQQSPATIQQLQWWPVPLNLLKKPEAVQTVMFSFYNGALFKVVATYDNDATTGLTDADMIAAISSTYGPANRGVVADAHADTASGLAEPIARWEDAQHSVVLSRESFLNSFTLVVSAKQLDAQAEASMVESAKQAQSDAPQKEAARTKQAADDLETARQSNLKAFRP